MLQCIHLCPIVNRMSALTLKSLLYLEVTVAPLGNEQSENLLLVKDRGKVVRILAPGDVALVVGLEGDVNLLVVNAVTPVRRKILA